MEHRIDDDEYAFHIGSPHPWRLALKTGEFLEPGTLLGKEIDGGAATLLTMKLDPAKDLESLTVRTLSNEVVIGVQEQTPTIVHLFPTAVVVGQGEQTKRAWDTFRRPDGPRARAGPRHGRSHRA